MNLNYYEYTCIKNSKLPDSWQSQNALMEMQNFLQENWEQRLIFYNDKEISGKQQFLEFDGQKNIYTKNYIGTISFKGHQLNIFPRVFKTNKNDIDTDDLSLNLLIKNLVNWIEYSTKFDYPYINLKIDFSHTHDLQELFISLYVRYVQAALKRSGFYKYEEKTEDLSTIRGRFDLRDYYCNKYAKSKFDKFSCTYSTFEFDNLLNQIIKYTLKYISKLSKTNSTNQKIIRKILMRMSDVSDKKCIPSDCDKIKLSKMQNNYRIILSMSKIFLMNSCSSYNVDKNESFCFLFPTEVLFEGFVAGFLQHILSEEAIVKIQDKEILSRKVYYGNEEIDTNITLRPDIVVNHKEKGIFILDTKYKETSTLSELAHNTRLLKDEIRSGDIYQVLVYAIKNGRDKVYLLYPQFRQEDIDLTPFVIPIPIILEDGKEKIINIHFVRLPIVFESDVNKTKENLSKILLSLF